MKEPKQPQPELLKCRVCNRAVEATAHTRAADFVLCDTHSAVLPDGTQEQHRLRTVREEIARGQVEESIDHPSGIRYFRRVEPQAPRPQPVSYDDDGTPRYRDMSNPTGLTFRPGIDIVQGGSDPRLDRYRDHEDDDGAQ